MSSGETSSRSSGHPYGDRRLASLTEKVMVGAGTHKTMHAPSGDGTLCGRDGYRVVDRAVVESHYQPCGDCFHPDEVDG